MRLRNMLKICLVFWKSEPQYAYKRYAYEKKMYIVYQNVINYKFGSPLQHAYKKNSTYS